MRQPCAEYLRGFLLGFGQFDVLRFDVLRFDVLRFDVLRFDVLRFDVLRFDVTFCTLFVFIVLECLSGLAGTIFAPLRPASVTIRRRLNRCGAALLLDFKQEDIRAVVCDNNRIGDTFGRIVAIEERNILTT